MRSHKTPRQEEACRLRRTLGWSLKRIARRLEITESAVSQLLARANFERTVPQRPPGRREGPRRRSRRVFRLRTTGFV